MTTTTFNIARIYKGYESKNNMAYESGHDSVEVAKGSLDYCKKRLIELGGDITSSDNESFTMTDESTGADIIYMIHEVSE